MKEKGHDRVYATGLFPCLVTVENRAQYLGAHRPVPITPAEVTDFTSAFIPVSLPRGPQVVLIAQLYDAEDYINRKLGDKIAHSAERIVPEIARGMSRNTPLSVVLLYSSTGQIAHLPQPIHKHPIPEQVNRVEQLNKEGGSAAYVRYMGIPFVVFGNTHEVESGIAFLLEGFSEQMEQTAENSLSNKMGCRIDLLPPTTDDDLPEYFQELNAAMVKATAESSKLPLEKKPETSNLTTDIRPTKPPAQIPALPALKGPYEACVAHYGSGDNVRKIGVTIVNPQKRLIVDHKMWNVEDYQKEDKQTTEEEMDTVINDVMDYCTRSGAQKVVLIQQVLPMTELNTVCPHCGEKTYIRVPWINH